MFAYFRGRGKRLRFHRKFELYGMTFIRGNKHPLTEEFVEEAGLRNEDTFSAVVRSLATDYGIVIKGNPDDPIQAVIANVGSGTGTKTATTNPDGAPKPMITIFGV